MLLSRVILRCLPFLNGNITLDKSKKNILGTYPSKTKGEKMATKTETPIQRTIQKLIASRGGYIPKKNHGNMITIKGLHDLPFTYKGFSCFFEVKTPNTVSQVSSEQGIHCRLARKALALTAIVSSIEEAILILDHLDRCHRLECTPTEMLTTMKHFFKDRGLNDGTKY
jgi:hypothetical protein